MFAGRVGGVEGEFCLLEMMRCMLLCMLDAVESGLSFGFRNSQLSRYGSCYYLRHQRLNTVNFDE